MNYIDTVNWMFKQLPMYQNKGDSALKKDLSNSLKLAKHLKEPQNNFNSIHIGGTNGKGSTSHMLASILFEAGYKVGLYTSPHLKDFRERIRINGNVISKQFVIGFIRRNKSFFTTHNLSFFEMTVGMAFDYFAKKKVDIAVVEVGLGGRLDSTNIINPKLSVITNIGLDHTQYLGNTIEKIAVEKAGIIKPYTPVVIGETQKDTKAVFDKKASIKNADIYYADQLIKSVIDSDLKGSYQVHNIKTVLQAIYVLRKLEFNISETAVKKGLLNVHKNTGLQGRWHILSRQPKIICDTAHNKEGLKYTMHQLQSEEYDKLHIVFGVVKDKDINGIIPLLPINAKYYFCKPNVERGMAVTKLHSLFKENQRFGECYSSVKEAVNAAKVEATKDDLIYIGGSTFVVAEII